MDGSRPVHPRSPPLDEEEFTVENEYPQKAPGMSYAEGHENSANSIPVSIFPIASDKFCIVFTGLPARGKTHISRRLARYLEFFHAIPVKLFDVATYRRKICGAIKDATWFDNTNSEGVAMRDMCNKRVLEDAFKFLQENHNGVAILDSTNPTHQRRQNIINRLQSTGVKFLFVEVNCDDQEFLANMYKSHAATSPDYEGVEIAEAARDYRQRIANYKILWEPLSDSHQVEAKWSFLKCDHSKHNFVLHNVRGYFPLKVVHFIMNLRTVYRPFYLTRHGQSAYNQCGRIGGDSGLSEQGVAYARKLAEFVEEQVVKDDQGDEIPGRLWTSSMQRTIQTAQFIKHDRMLIEDEHTGALMEWVQMRQKEWHHLDELFAGSCDGMTYEEIEEHFPEEFKLRQCDKLAYRYPRGESYLDVIARLEPIIIEMERHREPLLIVGHQGILRIIYAFYMGLSRAEAPYVSIPLNTVYEINPSAYDCKVTSHTLYKPGKTAADGQDEPTVAGISKIDPLNPPSH